jgi:hypothetical protein
MNTELDRIIETLQLRVPDRTGDPFEPQPMVI